MPDKNILVVTVKDPLAGPFRRGSRLTTDSDFTNTRPLLLFMKRGSEKLARNAYTAQFYVVEAQRGPGPDNTALQDAISEYLRSGNPRPDVIVPIGSAPTRAAREVVRRLSPSNKIPIVFTVVSDPGHEPLDDPIVDPGSFTNTDERITVLTGVSRSLIQTVRKCLDKFRSLLPDDHEIHWLIQPKLHQARKAHQELTGSSPVDTPPSPAGPQSRELKWHDITHLDGFEILQHIEDPQVLPWNDGRRSTRTGLLVIPDELVVSLAGKVITSAQAAPRRIPAFVQQLEWVLPGEWNPAPPYALAGFGLSPETIGQKAAEYVHAVLQDPRQAAKLPVHFFMDDQFEFWINRSVADDLGLKIPDQVLQAANRTFPERAGALPTAPGAPRAS